MGNAQPFAELRHHPRLVGTFGAQTVIDRHGMNPRARLWRKLRDKVQQRHRVTAA